MIDMDELQHRNDSQDGLAIDLAIIGAGVSGLYSGYRLLYGEFRSGVDTPKSVHVFEMSARVGGRLESIRLPRSSVIGELGGMRYTPSQAIVNSLINDVLDLKPVNFPLGDPANHIVYLRGQRFRANAWQAAQARGEKFVTRFDLGGDNAGYSPDQLLNKIVFAVLRNDPWVTETYGELITNPGQYDYRFRLNRRQWNEIKPRLRYYFDGSPYDGMPVNDMGFWNLIKDRVGNQGYEFIAAGGGYFSNTINWNAAEALPYMIGDFSGPDIDFMTLEGGYDQLAMALAKIFLDDDAAKLWTGNRLCTFEHSPDTDRRYKLTIFNEQQQSEWAVHTDRIILAMPRHSLELLDQQNFFFDRDRQIELHRNIDSIIKEPSFKLLMGFEQPWWQNEFGARAGESITDLPMRQCYYFGVDPINSHSLFLASYNDMRTVPFWNVLANDRSKNRLFKLSETPLVSREELEPWQDIQAPQALVDEALRQVRELHGLDEDAIADPYVTYFKDWSVDPYGGGYHAWRAGVDVKSIMSYMRCPDKNESVHICGEAYSDQQGWVEGAFCVAENMLQEQFGMTWPKQWLAQDYYLGW